jgi:outer membrane protein OmpA-like peptidoglycan-associated protein
MSEYHDEALTPVESDQPLTPAHGLRFDFDLSRQFLKLLVNDGAERCYPATVAQARERESRISRELNGGLDADAANDLLIQRSQLNRLERQLAAALYQQTCAMDDDHRKAGGGAHVAMAVEIEQLLNADNQFAFGSSALNPKYAGRLAQAAMLLANHAAYRLEVIGHTDQLGSEASNQQLSLLRAEQVSRYLQIFGVPESQIEVSALGENLPLSAGNQSHDRLVNRRVSITLIEPEPRKYAQNP